MIHGLKVSITPGTTRRKLLKQDETLAATDSTLNLWHSSLNSLADALQSNQEAWRKLFSSYTSFHDAAKEIYPGKDTAARESLQMLSLCQKRLESLSDSSDDCQSAYQRVEAAQKELTQLIERVVKAQQLHQSRMQTLRQLAYYRRKQLQLENADAKRKSPPTQKDTEKLHRTRSKVQNLDTQLENTVENLFSEMEDLDVKRLAIADRATIALITLQTHHFRATPVLDALQRNETVGFGRRVLPRDDSRPWLPSDRLSEQILSQTNSTGNLQTYMSQPQNMDTIISEDDPSLSACTQPELYTMPTAPPMSQPNLDVYASPKNVGVPQAIDPPRFTPLAPTAASSTAYYATAAAEFVQNENILPPTPPLLLPAVPHTPTAPPADSAPSPSPLITPTKANKDPTPVGM